MRYKLFNKNIITVYFICILLILGGIGSLIFGFFPTGGSILSVMGLIGIILSAISTHARNRNVDQFFEIMADLMNQANIGNVYIEKVKKELKEKGYCENAPETLLKALEIDPNNIEALELLSPILSMQLSFQLWLKGPAHLDPVEVQKAKLIAKKGLKKNPNNHVFYDSLGIINDIEGNYKQARKLFRKGAQYRKDPYWRILLAVSWNMSGNQSEALKEVEIAINDGAKGWNPYFVKGQILFRLGKYDEAIKDFEKVRKMRGSFVQVLYHLKDVYHFNGYFLKSAKVAAQLGFYVMFISPIRGIQEIFSSVIILLFTVTPIELSKIIWKISSFIPKIKIYPYVPELILTEPVRF